MSTPLKFHQAAGKVEEQIEESVPASLNETSKERLREILLDVSEREQRDQIPVNSIKNVCCSNGGKIKIKLLFH